MDPDERFEKKLELLREKALSRISTLPDTASESSTEEIRKLLHDLHVHQIELKLQNEELRQAHRDLERSRDRYLKLYHNAPVGYVVMDSAGMVMQANKTYAYLVDEDIATLLDKPLTHCIHADDRAVFLARFKAFYKNPAHKRIEVRFVKKDRSVIHAQLEGHRMDGEEAASESVLSGQLLVSISDITKRKAAEDAIIRAKAQWEQTFDAVPDLIAIIDEHSTVVRVNKALAGRLGMEPQDCVGKKCHQLLHAGQTRPSECPHQRFLLNDRIVESESFSRRLDGHFITTVSPFDSGAADNRWCIHIARDITKRKRAEAELLKLRNLESIGKLAGGMAHDFNNILTAVIGHVDLAVLHHKNRDRQHSHLKGAIEAANRARELANRLITFSEGGNQLMRHVDLPHLLEAVAAQTLGGSDIIYDLDLAADTPALVADEEQIKSAVQNILINAMEAMPRGGRLSIHAETVDLERSSGYAMQRGRYVKIVFRDDGIGIAAGDLGKIFDPYFTTKQMGHLKGTGLGLAICHSIISKHQGHIDVQSEPGEGTTVTILLPISLDAVPEARPDSSPVAEEPRKRRKVLYMDDEKILWNVIRSMLQRMGCDTDFAADGWQAVSLFRKSFEKDEPYTALILDLTIPDGPGGKEVLGEILQIDPSAKAVALSGYGSDPVFADFQKFGFAGALEKPFKTSRFFNLMSGILDLPR
jgi:two-component system, cell cycle sensor histidine kinase and response regulator CckA